MDRPVNQIGTITRIFRALSDSPTVTRVKELIRHIFGKVASSERNFYQRIITRERQNRPDAISSYENLGKRSTHL